MTIASGAVTTEAAVDQLREAIDLVVCSKGISS